MTSLGLLRDEAETKPTINALLKVLLVEWLNDNGTNIAVIS